MTHYEMGGPLAIKGFAAAILGGLGNPMAAVAGGLLVGRAGGRECELPAGGLYTTSPPSPSCCWCCSCGRTGCSAPGRRKREGTVRKSEVIRGMTDAYPFYAIRPTGDAAVAVQMLMRATGTEYCLTQLTMALYYAIVVLGLCLLMGYAGQVSLGHGAFFAIGGYTSAVLTTHDFAAFKGARLGRLAGAAHLSSSRSRTCMATR